MDPGGGRKQVAEALAALTLTKAVHKEVPPQFPVATGHERVRVLFVGESIAEVEAWKRCLAELDLLTETVLDARTALERINGFQPDLILLDSWIGNGKGFEICRQVKTDPAKNGTMVLMVTALNCLGDIERAVEVGTDDFLCKPVNKSEVVRRVRNMLGLGHQL